jgi:CO/xanthine dehydrogenase Mo-binding subunit
MSDYRVLGKSVLRKEALAKVTGAARYTADFEPGGLLEAVLVVSPHAHARIAAIDTGQARQLPGVRAVVTGADHPIILGEPLADRAPLAIDRVRYHGEPVAVVVADEKHQAMQAAGLVRVRYEPLPVVNSVHAAMQPGAPLIHPDLGSYKRNGPVYPVAGTNIASHYKIRKGNMAEGWAQCDLIMEAAFSLPQSDHAAMETRVAAAEVFPGGRLEVDVASQGPFVAREWLSRFFELDPHQVVIHTPLVGGAFGGKTTVQLELIAYLAAMAAGGRKVRLRNSREQDFTTSPCHIGLEATVKLGATREGRLVAAQFTYHFDGGAYSDRAVLIARAASQDCTGPYRIDHVHCDSYCLYTNHPFATAFRGFGHSELTFAMERSMDLLAERLSMDPLALRLLNAIHPGDTSPTQTELTASTVGDLPQCIAKLKELIRWEEEPRVTKEGHKVRAKGISCFWKNSSSPTDAGAGAVLLFTGKGSVRLVTGAVEIGQGTKTVLTQIVAERLRMEPGKVFVEMPVNTGTCPQHWKTVASRSTHLVGRAALAAADDATAQLKAIAALVLKRPAGELEVGEGRVYVAAEPETGVEIGKLAEGYKYADGHVVGWKVVGRGGYIMEHLTDLDPETGKGRPGPEWGVGAQAVEVEFDTHELTYKLIRAATVVDAGVVLNERAARGQMTGGMSMGLSFAGREALVFGADGRVLNPQLRSYHLHRFGEQPEYQVAFVQTPHLEGAYGLRGIGEHGVIGMPGALANSLSLAAGVPLNRLPLTAEMIWRTLGEASR